MTQRARDRYPNVAALAQGLMSGRLAEWPALKPEARELLDEVDRWHDLAQEAIEVAKPDYLLRGLVALMVVLLVAGFLFAARFGMHS